jgi:predicted site-specific integrase-resolvase
MLSTLKETAEELKISLRQVKKLVKAGRWPIYRISERIVRVDPEEIKQLSRIKAEGETSVNK